MSNIKSRAQRAVWIMAALLSTLAAGCGSGGQDQVLGAGGAGVAVALAPTVTAVSPANNATGVTTDNPVVTATFSEPMAAITSGANFTLTCAAPCTNPTGTVALDGSGTVASFALTPATSLTPLTLYTATVTGVKSLATGVALANPYEWSFTTGTASGTAPPAVTSTAPATTSPGPTAGVATNTAIAAAFTEEMAPTTISTATFTITCTSPCVSPSGTVTYVAGSRTAVFTPDTVLAAGTTYTATITDAATNVAGDALAGNQAPSPAASNYVWTFTTSLTPDTTRPAVMLTAPATTNPGPTANVPTNTAIVATFTEDMAPATINAATFTVTCTAPCVSPAGNVSYALGAQTATFTPEAALMAGVTYTATITDAATDLAGNALAGNQAALPAASNYVWTFTTASAVPAADVSVLSTNPSASEGGVCSNTSINATFSVPSGLRMNPLTVTAATFIVTGPAPDSIPVTPASVTLDAATGQIATFTPLSAFTSGETYTATITGGASGVEDLAVPANQMATDYTWTFTAGPATVNCPTPEPLGAAAAFVFFSSAALTNQGTAPNTTINGDAGTTGIASSITGLHDSAGNSYTETCPSDTAAVGCGLVNGTIYASDAPPDDPLGEGTTVTAAAAAALVAYGDLSPAGRPGGLNVVTNSEVGTGGLPGELGGRTLAPGVYYSGARGVPSYQITAGDLTLDAGGNANAVWVFQMDSTLLVSTPTGPTDTVARSVLLINGAQAKNVFWYVPGGATINTGSVMSGTIIANATITFGTSTGANPVIITTLNGRALVLSAGATMVNTVITVPGP